MVLASVAWGLSLGRPRALSPSEVPIAFWSWRSSAPSAIDLNDASSQTRATSLFLHAGQFDLINERISRIRPVSGPLPSATTLFLVYNATRDLLGRFERLSSADLAAQVARTIEDDLQRADGDGAYVSGVQVDWDIPTRLLPKFGEFLAQLRKRLSPGCKLSITGLPTWMSSPNLLECLSHCDFWVPQFYGDVIPDRIDESRPISSPDKVRRSATTARRLGHPFLAGLAAYEYALHYSANGTLVGVRGDLDPVLLAGSDDLELLDESGLGQADGAAPAEWRFVYRSRHDLILDGTPLRRGEFVVVQRPTASGLRASARAVRECGGGQLLGICLFRLPSRGDTTTLSLGEVACALSDSDQQFSIEAGGQEISPCSNGRSHVALTLKNTGSASSLAGSAGFTGMFRFPSAGLRTITVSDGASVEPVYNDGSGAVPCTETRANAIRVYARLFQPGAVIRVNLELLGPTPSQCSLSFEAHLDDATVARGTRTFSIQQR
ncbi:MAG TPA: DUF3142 domain-containing protein [Blastocatellia bacterium]|nr:DUF3142 domain-containing protein [Blastocatellia bacterium]